MPGRMLPADPLTRRSFLAVATTGAGVVGIGAAGWGLLGSMSPSADVIERTRGFVVRLSDIPEGTELAMKYFGVPLFIRHRTAEEIAAAESVDPEDIWYNETIDILGRPIGTADDRARRATPNGKYIALIGQGSGFGCVPLGDGAGDFNGWFDPCRGAHDDTSGRFRKGAAHENLRLPTFELVGEEALLFTDPKTTPKSLVEELLYR